VTIEFALYAHRLRQLREQRGWSQRELARRCGFSNAMIRNYEEEDSNPSASALKKLVEQLGVSADYLLGFTDDPRGHYGDGQIDESERIMLDTYRRESWPGVIRLGVTQIEK